MNRLLIAALALLLVPAAVVGVAVVTPAAVVAAAPKAAITPLKHAATAGLATSLVVQASGATLSNAYTSGVTGGAAGYLIMYNSKTVPGTGALNAALVEDFCGFDATGKGCSISTALVSSYRDGLVALITTATNPYVYTTGTDTAGIVVNYQSK